MEHLCSKVTVCLNSIRIISKSSKCSSKILTKVTLSKRAELIFTHFSENEFEDDASKNSCNSEVALVALAVVHQ